MESEITLQIILIKPTPDVVFGLQEMDLTRNANLPG